MPLKKLRLGLLAVGLLAFALVFLGFRRHEPAQPAQVTPELAVQLPDLGAAPESSPAPSIPDQLDPAAWRSGNLATESEVDNVEAELALADQLLADGQIYAPDQTAALGRYAAILRANPAHEAATEGFNSALSLLMEQLREHAQRREISAGAGIYQALRRVGVESPELTVLGDRLEALEKSAGLMARAEQDIQAGRLLEPAGRSALDRLRRALQLDPSSTALADRLVALERRLVEAALAAARNREFVKARRLLDGAQRARGGSSAVVSAGQQVASFRQEQIEQTSSAARLAMADSRYRDAEQAIESARSLGAESSLVAALNDELRHSRLYSVYQPGQNFADPLAAGGSGPTMVVLPHGSFQMGARVSDEQQNRVELPAHTVNFARGFALARHEVTVAQFSQFVNASGYQTDAEREGFSQVYREITGRVGRRSGVDWRRAYNGREAEPDMPVVHVSFADARAYSRWLAEQTNAPYRLPSEAEFEYGARAGRQTRYWWGDGAPDTPVENLTGEGDRSAREMSWTVAFDDYSDGYWGPAPAARLSANPFGLFDMTGNVQEWVADCWHDSYVRAPGDGSAWVNRGCDLRVVRGTFWGGAPETARASARHAFDTGTRGASIGFRVARDLVVLPPQVANH